MRGVMHFTCSIAIAFFRFFFIVSVRSSVFLFIFALMLVTKILNSVVTFVLKRTYPYIRMFVCLHAGWTGGLCIGLGLDRWTAAAFAASPAKVWQPRWVRW